MHMLFQAIIGLHLDFGTVGKVIHLEYPRTGLQSNSSRILAVIDLYISIVEFSTILFTISES